MARGPVLMMIDIPGYDLLGKLHESSKSIVYRGLRASDGVSVILKSFCGRPSESDLARLRHEYEILRYLESVEGVIRPYAMEQVGEKLWLVMEDIGGESLEKLFPERMGLSTFLDVALPLTRVLGEVHKMNIIHRDINPSNIVYDTSTRSLRIIDFDIVAECSFHTQEAVNPGHLEGSLPYMSPEQTGRMNRKIDFRSDLYSLGITFYRLLSGRLPFETEDPMELVHSHIAARPAPASHWVPGIPLPVDRLISKLLEKTAEDRYQSAYGVYADLSASRDCFEAGEDLELLELRHARTSDRFQVPEKLYGRERQVHQLMTAFDRAGRGGVGLMLVSGTSGAGKSALIQEIQKPVVSKRGYFISGKFDPYNRGTPYAPLIQAFRDLVRQILTESEDEIATWKRRMLAALRQNGQIIIDVIPEMALIMGEQPDVPRLPPLESQNRFQLVFRLFVEVLAAEDHPLVLFLDDMQWVDGPSLNLTTLLLTDPRVKFFFVIGSYRDNELGETHILTQGLDQLEKADVIIDRIILGPLVREDVHQFLRDTLHRDDADLVGLSRLCLEKTMGNPFFLRQFLDMLYRRGLIQFDGDKGQWIWDLEAIRDEETTDNVVDLMTGKIRDLPEETRGVLELAAAIGNRFDLRTLSIVNQATSRATGDQLWPALLEGLVLPLDEDYKLMRQMEDVVPEFRFLHDRVRQAAYSMIPDESRKKISLQVGRLLYSKASADEMEPLLFEVAHHLNLARDLIKDPRRRIELILLNLHAAAKARESAAYEAAYTYLGYGLEMMEPEYWETEYSLALGLHVDAAEAAYLNLDYARMEELIKAVLVHASSLLGKFRAYEVRIRALIAMTKPLEAVRTGLELLGQLGFRFPEKPSQGRILLSLVKTIVMLWGKNPDELAKNPRMEEMEPLVASRVFNSIADATFIAAPTLFPLMVLHWVRMSVREGNSDDSAFAFMAYGMILCRLHKYESAYRYGQLALRLMDEFDNRKLRPVIFVGNYAFIWPWREHLRNNVANLREAHQQALEIGDFEYAAYSALFYVEQAWYLGENLDDVERIARQYGELFSQLERESPRQWFNLILRFSRGLSGKTARFNLLEKGQDESLLIKELEETNNEAAILGLHFYSMIYHFLFREYASAVSRASRAEPYLETIEGRYQHALFLFYDVLSRLALHPDSDPREARRSIGRIKKVRKLFKRWARNAPDNFLHKMHLIEAEYGRIRGHRSDAENHYHKAMATAREHGFPHEETLAYEMAAHYYQEAGDPRRAETYLRAAHVGYLQWGARAKAKDIEERNPNLFVAEAPLLDKVTSTSTTLAGNFDLGSVVKASQAISGEIVINRLLDKLMKFVVENAGAHRGFLLLADEEDGHLTIEAESSGGLVNLLGGGSLESCRELPHSIVNFVARTQENVLLANASTEGPYVSDPYIREKGTKSVLCSPILSQGGLVGVLYLDNDLSSGAFPKERLEVVRVLSAQAAISIRNARLYDRLEAYNRTLEQRVEERTRALSMSNRELETLDGIVEVINRETRLDTMLQTILDQAMVLFQQAEKGIVLHTGPTGLLRLAASKGIEVTSEGDVFHLEDILALDREELAKGIHAAAGIRSLPETLRCFEPALSTLRISLSPEGTGYSSLILLNSTDPDAFGKINVSRMERFREHTLSALAKARLLSELREKNREILNAQQKMIMQEKMASIGTLTTGVAHELKNPLNFINNFSDIATNMSSELSEMLDQRAHLMDHEGLEDMRDLVGTLKHNAERIHHHGLRANSIIESMMSLAREDAGDRRLTQINQLVKELVNVAFHGHENNHLVEMEKDLSDELGEIIVAPQSLSRVVVNLVNNAIEAVTEYKEHAGEDYHPKVSVSTARVGDMVEIRVSDNGPGIPEKNRDQVFTPFFTTKTDKHPHIGLGLTISYEIVVREHGGQLRVNSQPGHTELIVALPSSRE